MCTWLYNLADAPSTAPGASTTRVRQKGQHVHLEDVDEGRVPAAAGAALDPGGQAVLQLVDDLRLGHHRAQARILRHLRPCAHGRMRY